MPRYLCTGSKDHDRIEQPNGMYQHSELSEAVDPQTVASGVGKKLTERAWAALFGKAWAAAPTSSLCGRGADGGNTFPGAGVSLRSSQRVR
ncbi:DUF6009 family protein [Streptomyces mirabilis]|uniref:DUF6009 family protein n=1 Tax=Streptomyces mirabilis TaxID=68239 RepID=UPI0036A09045